MTGDEMIREPAARCQHHLIKLRMLGRAKAADELPQGAAAAIRDTVNAVLAEIVAAGPPVGSGEPFLGVRLARLAAAADDTIRAAQDANVSDLRGYVHRFDSLVSAIWVVQDAIRGRRTAPQHPHRGPRPARTAPLLCELSRTSADFPAS